MGPLPFSPSSGGPESHHCITPRKKEEDGAGLFGCPWSLSFTFSPSLFSSVCLLGGCGCGGFSACRTLQAWRGERRPHPHPPLPRKPQPQKEVSFNVSLNIPSSPFPKEGACSTHRGRGRRRGRTDTPRQTPHAHSPTTSTTHSQGHATIEALQFPLFSDSERRTNTIRHYCYTTYANKENREALFLLLFP